MKLIALGIMVLFLNGCFEQHHQNLCIQSNDGSGSIPTLPGGQSSGDPPVPEPTTLLIFGGGLAALVASRLRKKVPTQKSE